MTEQDRHVLMEQANQLVVAYQSELKSRAIASLYEQVGIPFTLAACGSFLLWPIFAVYVGSLGVAAAILTAAGAAVYGVNEFQSKARAVEDGGNSLPYLTPEDRSLMTSKGRTLNNTLNVVEQTITGTTKKPLGAAVTPSGNGTKPASNGRASDSLAVAPCALDEAAPHLFLVGRTQEGKSETLKHLIGHEQRVWYVTSKHTDAVPSHWRGYRVGGPTLASQINWLLDQWEAALLNHMEGQDTGREWFVLDEAVGILQNLKTRKATATAARLRGFIVEVVTAGAAIGAFVALLSQTGNSGPIGIDLDLLKNCSIVACGKRKKPHMVAAFTKLTGLQLTAEQQQHILSLPGYWQLWEQEQPTLSQVPLSHLPTAMVSKCPAPEPSPVSGSAIAAVCQQGDQSVAQKVLDWFAANPGYYTVAHVKKSVRPLPEWEKTAVDDLLTALAQAGKLIANDGRYAIAETSLMHEHPSL